MKKSINRTRKINSTMSIMLLIILSVPFIRSNYYFQHGLIEPIEDGIYYLILLIIVGIKLLYNLIRMAIYDRRGLVIHLIILLLFGGIASGIVFQNPDRVIKREGTCVIRYNKNGKGSYVIRYDNSLKQPELSHDSTLYK